MTRATLLHVLDRPTALGPAEVRELEQLAQAFPYCQTAHLLLAKAAHDQGTMLASQRLRRAATYAADRTLLRRLIEQVEPAVTDEAPVEERSLPEPALALEPATPPVAAATLAPAAVEIPAAPALPAEVPTVSPVVEAVIPVPAQPVAVIAPEPVPEVRLIAEVAPTPEPILPAPVSILTPEPIVLAEVVSVPAAGISELPVPENSEPEAAVASVEAEADVEVVALPAETELPGLFEQEGVQITAAAPAIEVEVALVEEVLLVVAEPIAEPETEVDLPAQAPAIRPPVEVGEARFEFGLAETPPPAVPVYELPGLVDEWAAAAVTLSLGGPGLVATPTVAAAPIAPAFTPAAFTGDAAVGYAFGESSRLGLSMQLLDLLTAKAETAESSTAVIAAAQPPATALPPAGTFFEPDPLLADHWTTHCPPPPTLPSSLDLINNFLKRQPRLTRPAILPPAATHQADLSVRSTRAEPDLVSENLARIFVRQGKIARAIEIYEKLMVKQPEKMAYFAAQIQSLQPSA